jgi:hypothetical protein
MDHKIKVVVGTDIKREAVLINPNISASDNPTTGEQAKNVIAEGQSSTQLLKKYYGKGK